LLQKAEGIFRVVPENLEHVLDRQFWCHVRIPVALKRSGRLLIYGNYVKLVIYHCLRETLMAIFRGLC
jgi:hypothetical protein